MEQFQRLIAQLRAFWGGLSFVRRLLLVGATAAVFVGLGAFTFLSQGAGYVPLYTQPISEQETAEVTSKLKTLTLPYKLDTATSTIQVPAERLVEIRVALAGEGIPVRGGKGLESFDESNPMTTPFGQNVNYQRAMQAELARSMLKIDVVADARVLIARPDPTPFIRDQKPTTASVVLKLKANAALTRGQANSIVMLASRSVEGLKPENVTVVDSTGRMLSDPHLGEKDDQPHGLMDYRRELETYLSSKAQEMLSHTLGAGRVVVRVNAEINHQKVKERETKVSATGNAMVAERLTTTKGSSGGARGAAGAVSNLSRGSSGGGGGGGTSSEEVVQTDYRPSELVREMEDRMGAVKRLTISAVVDLSAAASADGQPAAPPISKADAEEIIKNAVGFQAGRDVMKLSDVRMTIATPTIPEPDEEVARLQRFAAYVALARNVSLAVAVVMGLSVVPLLLLLRRRAKPAAAPAVAATGDDPTAELPPDQRRQQLVERFLALARSDPDRTANVFGLLANQTGG